MIQGFYTAKTALRHRQIGMDVLSNNFSNVNTDTYKKNNATFQDALYNLTMKQYPGGERNFYQIGSGAFISNIGKDFSQGPLKETGENLDLALEGAGFFGINDDNGNIFFSRGGSYSFTPSEENPGSKHIANNMGYYLIDTEGQRIVIPDDNLGYNIGSDGVVSYRIRRELTEQQILDGESEIVTINQSFMLVNFNDPSNLASFGEGIYGVSDLSGGPFATERATVRTGFLEGSNVDLSKEMVDLILHQRIFELNARIIQTVDEMESLSNNLRK
jgi:flagellar basal body rod protein FlgG